MFLPELKTLLESSSIRELSMRGPVLRRRLLIAAVILLGILILCFYPKVYLIRGSAAGTLYWNNSQALLFMGGGVAGARMSFLRYAVEPLIEIGRVPGRPPDDSASSQIVVIRVTDKDIQQFDTDLARYADEPHCDLGSAVFGGHIYFGCLVRGPMWKWSGDKLELATPDDLRGFDPTKATPPVALHHPWEFDGVDGWSMRELNENPPKNELILNGQPVTIIFHGETWPKRPLSVDLVRPGQSPQTIWSFDGRVHMVSRSEYEHAFEKP
jgi:hypothetical protein